MNKSRLNSDAIHCRVLQGADSEYPNEARALALLFLEMKKEKEFFD